MANVLGVGTMGRANASDGKWVTSALDETFSTINPATGEKLVDVAHAGKEDVDAAVAAARRAFKTTWGMQIAATERARCESILNADRWLIR